MRRVRTNHTNFAHAHEHTYTNARAQLNADEFLNIDRADRVAVFFLRVFASSPMLIYFEQTCLSCVV